MIDQINNSSDEILYVVTNIFNPEGSEIRYKLYRDFKTYMASFSNVILITIELAFKDAPFVVTNGFDLYNVQLRSDDILWYKENLNNIVFRLMRTNPNLANVKVAWIDGDMSFTNQNWVTDTLKALDTYKFVQMYDTCDSLGPNKEVLTSDRSFVYNWFHKLDTPQKRGRSGGAWASTISTLHQIGYLIDWDILGASDWFTVFGLTNQVPWTATPCKAKNELWMQKVKEHVNGSVGYVDGTLIHYFHGYPSDRGYGTRGAILIENEFDPDVDIGYREDGLIYFTTDKPKLRQDIIEHFKSKKIHGPEDLILSL